VLRHRLLQTTLIPEAEIAPLPPLWSGIYREQATYLEPEQPGDPFLTILTAHEVRGTWDVLTWQALLMNDLDLTLSVDVFTNPRQSEKQLEDAARSLEAARKAVRYDQRSDRAQDSVRRALAVADTQHLHRVHYAVLLQERTLKRLEDKAAKVRELMGRRLRFEQVKGAQRAYAQLFTETPPWRITAPLILEYHVRRCGRENPVGSSQAQRDGGCEVWHGRAHRVRCPDAAVWRGRQAQRVDTIAWAAWWRENRLHLHPSPTVSDGQLPGHSGRADRPMLAAQGSHGE
jgi:hypothetical protein